MEKGFDFESKSDLVRMFIDYTPIAYVILDRDYRICYINESFAKLRQIDAIAVAGDKCYNISNGGLRCKHCAVARAFETGEKAFLSRKDYMPDGTIRFVDDYAIPLQKNDQGEIEYVLEMMIDRTKVMLTREQRNMDYDGILSLFSILLEEKDPYTATHSENVRKLSVNIAKALNLVESDIFGISVAASLHDIGKVNVPDSILNKPGKLTGDEYNVIKHHPFDSYMMIEGLSSFENIKRIVLYHHERVDGKGYPYGLTGEEIPIGAKIIAVADTYDAMTSTRTYRSALSHEYAVNEIKSVMGTQLDETVVTAFLKLDFDNLVDNFYAPDPPDRNIERVLIRQEGEKDIRTPLKMDIDIKNLMMEIFKNTPCGYLLMDKNLHIRYASDHFMNYMQVDKNEICGEHCYKAGGLGKEICEECPVKEALRTGRVSYMRKRQYVKGSLRVFDAYGVPLMEADGQIEYLIEIVIDRIDETELETSRKHDFAKLIGILDEILEKQEGDLKERHLSDKVITLRKMLNNIQV